MAHTRAQSKRHVIVVPGALLREIRSTIGLSQSQLATELGISHPSIQRLEEGGGNAFERLAFIGWMVSRGREMLAWHDYQVLLRRLEDAQFPLDLEPSI